MQPSRTKYLLSLLLLLLLIAGCTPSTSVRTQAPPDDPEVAQARALAADGHALAAAQLFEQVAMRSDSPLRETLLLSAAENYFHGLQIERANQLLDQINVQHLPGLDFQKRLLVAELALAQSHPDRALSLLSVAPPAEANVEQLKRYHKNRAEAFRLNGNLLESAGALAELDPLLTEMEPKLDNQLTIIQTLAALTDTALELLQPNPPGIQGGWMELTRIVKTSISDQSQLPSLLESWRARFPTHPAVPELLDSYFQRLKAQYRQPNHIAILLPESGRYAQAAAALKQGFMAAYYQAPANSRPRLRFYDSSNSADTWPLYRQAVDNGAEMIIGPINKESVALLAAAGELELPVLALNQVPSDLAPPSNLFQFGLSPEDEARQVAERAWLDGHTRAIALTPSGNWGDRLLRAFRDRWERLGGRLSEQQQYNPANDDFSAPIRALLNIDESSARRARLQQVLGKQLEFEPRRRQDADFVFLAAQPQKARQIRPQLQFHHASNLPIYATSHLFSGSVQADADQDLEGIKFLDIPWLLVADRDNPLSQENIARSLPQSQGGYRRLYAMGMDSFRLLPHLGRLQSSPLEILDGATGNLYLDNTQQVRRQLVWAEMKRGTPNPIGFAPRMDSSNDMLQAPVDAPMTTQPEPGPQPTSPANTPAPQPGQAPRRGTI